MFFRIVPDLQMNTRFSDQMIRHIGRISSALSQRGSALVFVPIPTKALAESDLLGPVGTMYGYDARLAKALYLDTLSRIRAEGVTTINALDASNSLYNPQTSFFGTDPRMSPTGLRALANAVAAKVKLDGEAAQAVSLVPSEPLALASPLRFSLQLLCQVELPEVTAQTFSISNPNKLPIDTSIAVVGSTITNDPALGFAAFLSDALQRHVGRNHVAESATDALAELLTSIDGSSDLPKTIVWMMPIWENPMVFGDQPVRELTAASTDNCRHMANSTASPSNAYQTAFDSALSFENESLKIEVPNSTISQAAITFTNSQGQHRTRNVIRRGNATNTIFVPLSGLWPQGVSQVSLEISPTPESPPQVSVCKG